MKTPKCYIAGKVTGLKPEQARNNFNHGACYAQLLGYETVVPIEICQPQWSWLRCMVKCIPALLRCKAIYPCHNWSESKGAKIEVAIAIIFGKQIL